MTRLVSPFHGWPTEQSKHSTVCFQDFAIVCYVKLELAVSSFSWIMNMSISATHRAIAITRSKFLWWSNAKALFIFKLGEVRVVLQLRTCLKLHVAFTKVPIWRVVLWDMNRLQLINIIVLILSLAARCGEMSKTFWNSIARFINVFEWDSSVNKACYRGSLYCYVPI